MKAPAFRHTAPSTLDDALALLAEHGDRARVLAGGQSLLQDLRWRRLAPDVLVDIAHIDELARVAVTGAEVRIGARVRHRDVEHGDAVPGPLGTLLRRAAVHIAHPPVRTRGTVVGSLAWAHPCAEWATIAAGLGARVRLASVRGPRELPVAEFLRGPGRTARAPDELVTTLVLPRLPDDVRVGFAEHRRTHASFAQVAVAAAVQRHGGVVHRADIGLGGVGPVALRADAAAEALTGRAGAADDLARAAALASRDDTDADAAPHDPHATPEHRRHVAGVLLRRLLTDLEDTR